jgi:hypothetical protein
MAIKPPAWAKDAVPTLRGWKHPKRNEILVNKKFTQAEINEYLGIKPEPKVAPVVENKPKRTRKPKVQEVAPVEETIEVLPEEPVVEDVQVEAPIETENTEEITIINFKS